MKISGVRCDDLGLLHAVRTVGARLVLAFRRESVASRKSQVVCISIVMLRATVLCAPCTMLLRRVATTAGWDSLLLLCLDLWRPQQLVVCLVVHGPHRALTHTHLSRLTRCPQALLSEASHVLMPNTGQPVRLRVGIHSGPAMSGVVGTRMPRFVSVQAGRERQREACPHKLGRALPAVRYASA